MKKIKLITFLLFINLFLAPFVDAIEKERLKTFFTEYDASAEKQNWAMERIPYAIEKGYTDIAEFLILKGDSINSYRELRPNPVKTNTNDIYIKHPLLTAIKKNYVDLAVLIIQTCKDLSRVEEYKQLLVKLPGQNNYQALDNVDRKTAIYLAINENPNGHDIVLALLLAGVDMNISHSHLTLQTNGYYNYTIPTTPLKSAIALKKLNIAKLLLENNADVDYLGNTSVTPLYLAIKDNYIEAVDLLLSYGADPLKPCYDINSSGSLTPLGLAMKNGYWDIVDLLLDASIK